MTPSMTPGTLTLTPRTPLDPHTDPLDFSTLPRTPLDPHPVSVQNQQELGMHWGVSGEGGTLFGVQEKEEGTFWSLWWLRDDHGHRVPWNPGMI